MPLLRSLSAAGSLPELRQHYPFLDLLRPYAQALMRGPSPLSPGERELIAAYVSGLNSCSYCYGSHSRVAQGFGLAPDLLESLLDNLETAPIEPRLKPLLHYARKLTETPSRMSPADAAAVYAADWNDEALMHTIAVCAYFNNMNRLIAGTGISGTPGVYEHAAQRLLETGYDKPAEALPEP
ncbi:MAG: peroxidase-related enzyme [Pseudomonadales bacterium]|nr:peroxidase-related enzyme [Pseudomonadales bacterium]